MKTRKRIWNIIVCLCLMMMCSGVFFTREAKAYDYARLEKKGSIIIGSGVEKKIYFYSNDGEVPLLDMGFNYGNISYKDKIRIRVVNEEYGQVYSNDVLTFQNGYYGDLGEGGYLSDRRLPEGYYYYSIKNNGTQRITISYKLYMFSGFANSISLKTKNVELKVGGTKKVAFDAVPHKYLPWIKKITSSNNKVASFEWDPLKRTLQIWGERPGKCTLTVILKNGKKYAIKVKVTAPEKVKLDTTKLSLVRGEKYQNYLYYGSGSVSWSSSNPAIATVSKTGLITGKGIGKCTITAKYKGKKYNCAVTVKRVWPSFDAVVYDYNTRDNYFVVKFKNRGAKPLTIVSGDKVEEIHYKTFDRSIYLKKKVVIPARKAATVRFYVRGDVTWYDYTDYTLCYNVLYDGKKYPAHVWYKDSVIKVGSKWYNSYWDDSLYSIWLDQVS